MCTSSSLLVSDSYMLILQNGDSARVNPVDPVKLQCATDKLGVPIMIGLDGNILHASLVIYLFWGFRNVL